MNKPFLAQFRRNAGCYGLLLPTLLFMAVFTAIPFFWAFSTSFYQYEVGGDSKFIGLRNYVDFVHDPTFWPNLGHMAFLTCFGVVVVMIFPLLFARLIFSLRSERARYFYRVLFLIPQAFPTVAVIMIWGGLMYSDFGLVNATLRFVGLGGLARSWLSDPKTALWAIAFVGFPWANGIQILIYYAGFSSIPESVLEAAEIEGATGLRKFFGVELPMVFSQVRLLVILAIIAGVQGFEGVLILTEGGPGFRSMVPGLWMYYNAFSFQRMGMACAIGVVLFLVILGLTILNLRYFRSSEELQEVRR